MAIATDIVAPRPDSKALQPAEPKRRKRLLLFSDGTGNSSAKLFKTNVWRLYEAADLRPQRPGTDIDQIAYYDNGIGTHPIKPLAAVQGIFGWGLRRNALAIYRFACRNYNDGDAICAFGFSRGAFTVRVVIALIEAQGLVPYTTERELRRRSAAAYRAFRKPSLPRLAAAAFVVDKLRKAGELFRRHILRRPAYSETENRRPPVDFIGVWDTVAAYGGPIQEVTRGIDNWFFRLSMPDYVLPRCVRGARHALALDDERDSFYPLLWNEVAEAALVKADAHLPDDSPGKIRPGRLQQVWFAGMHADVGGGYPDESLSYVSLCWMMDEAKKHGVELLPDLEERIRQLSSSYGPLHNSREGLASFYRYQPRRITAWLHPPEHYPQSYILRDPLIRDSVTQKPQGLLAQCAVHESVVARIASGTDDYAPIALPDHFTVVPPIPAGANIPLLAGKAARERLAASALTATRANHQRILYDDVWKRRVLYFVTLAFSAALISMPLWRLDDTGPSSILFVRIIAALISLPSYLLPGFVGRWFTTWSAHPFLSIGLLAAILLSMRISSGIELRFRDAMRKQWRAVAEGETPPSIDNTRLQRIRESNAYQRGLQRFKWVILPNLVAPLMLIVAVWLIAAIGAQVRIMAFEAKPNLCSEDGNGERGPRRAPDGARSVLRLQTRAICNPTGLTVAKGRTYVITMEVTKPWGDGGIDASPRGLEAPMFFLCDWLGTPFKRVVSAGWMQPVAAIHPAKDGPSILGDVVIIPLTMKKIGPTTYEGSLDAPIGGMLSLFVNDVVPPFGRKDMFYKGRFHGGKIAANRGRAIVAVTDRDLGDTALQAVIDRTILAAPGE